MWALLSVFLLLLWCDPVINVSVAIMMWLCYWCYCCYYDVTLFSTLLLLSLYLKFSSWMASVDCSCCAAGRGCSSVGRGCLGVLPPFPPWRSEGSCQEPKYFTLYQFIQIMGLHWCSSEMMGVDSHQVIKKDGPLPYSFSRLLVLQYIQEGFESSDSYPYSSKWKLFSSLWFLLFVLNWKHAKIP